LPAKSRLPQTPFVRKKSVKRFVKSFDYPKSGIWTQQQAALEAMQDPFLNLTNILLL
jgi:hypothetical protein